MKRTTFVVQEFFIGQWDDLKGATFQENERARADSAYEHAHASHYRPARLIMREETVLKESTTPGKSTGRW